jgi:hypothetical protein
MTSTLQSQRRTRRVVPVLVIVAGLLLISAIMFQQVAAQSNSGLKPPFKLHQPAKLAAPLSGVPPLPLNAPIIMSQTFDSSFVLNTSYNFNVSDTSAPWHLVNPSGVVDTSYTWGPISGAPLTDTLWNAATNPPGSTGIVAGEPYTKNMQAYAIYGPINLEDYTSAFISMTYVLDTLDNDLFGVAFSTNGTDFTMPSATFGRDPSLSIKRTTYYVFPKEFVRQKQVWIALVFTSEDRDNIDALGVFVSDVVLRAQPAFKLYMPIIRRDPTPTPTLTPTPSITYRYIYQFNDETSTNNPDFNRWGGYKDTSCGSGCTYYQDLVKSPNGNPPPAFTLYMQGTNGRGGAGPRQNGVSLSTALNFEYSADFYVYNGQLEARYGLVFDASSGTFPNSGNPPIDPYVNYYLLELHMDSSTRTKVATWQVVKVENGTRNVLVSNNLPVSLNQGQWHNLKVKQQGTTISAYLNGALLGTANYSSSWGDARRRFGLYIDVRNSNGDNGPFEFFSDNITVIDLP